MNVKVLVDVNLSPAWAQVLTKNGIEAIHRSSVGDPRATDAEMMVWAKTSGFLVFTHDLDFGTALALTGSTAPSVLQVRGSNVLPEPSAHFVLSALHAYRTEFLAGALVVIDERKSRVRILPLEPKPK